MPLTYSGPALLPSIWNGSLYLKPFRFFTHAGCRFRITRVWNASFTNYLSKVSQRSFGAYPVIELGRGNQNAQGPGPLAHMFIYTCTSLGRTLVVRWFSRLYHMYRFRTNHNAPQWPRFIVWHINVPKRY